MAGSAPARCSPAMIPAEVLQSPDITTGQAPDATSPATVPATADCSTAMRSQGSPAGSPAVTTCARLEREVQVGQVFVQVVRDG